MKSLIIGAGEVGKGLHKVIGGKIMDREMVKGQFDIIHICFPYSKDFTLQVTKYQLQYKPKLTVIHSTVPVGTSKKLGAIHSPIRGVHPNLAKGIKTFVKYVGGVGAEMVAKIFKDKGMKVRVVKDSNTTEALKLLDTFQYGVQIWLNKFIYNVCKKHDLDFDIIYKDGNKTYNEGYTELGREEVVRPYLNYYDEPLKGHCILENAVQLWEMSGDDEEIKHLVEHILSMGKHLETIGSKKPYLDRTWLYCEYWGKGRSLKDIGKEFGVTGENIGGIMKRLGIKTRDKKWTEKEIESLKKLSKTMTFKEIAKELGKTHDAVRTEAIKLGLKSIYKPSEETKKLKTRKKLVALYRV